MKTLVCVMSDGGEGERYHIGTVMLNDIPENLDGQMQEWWEGFRQANQYPDSDSDFVDWLIESGFAEESPMEVTYATINV